MVSVEIYSKEWCPYCAKAKALLESKEVEYSEIDVTSDLRREQEMVKRSRRRTVPQVFVKGHSIGGYDDLAYLNATGELDRLLEIDGGPQPTRVHDVAVIGTRPAGMSAETGAGWRLHKVNRIGETGVRGVFAAGDVTDNREKQIVSSAGEGYEPLWRRSTT